MKIAFNMVSATHGGGFQTYNSNIIDQILSENDYSNNELYIFTNDKSYNTKNNKIHLVYVSDFFSKTIPRLFWMQFILPIHLVIKRINSLFCPMNIVPIISKILRIKTILVVHSNLPWLYPNDLPGSKIKLLNQKLLMNISIKIADKIIVDSKTANMELNKIFRNISKKTTTVYLGVKKVDNSKDYLDKFVSNNLDIMKEEYFLTISSAVKYHCLIELIAAYNLLCNEYKKIPKYLIITKNLNAKYFAQINKKISESNFSNKIILLENIDSKKISDLYKNSSLYIFSSYCEVFGLTNLEAMIYGIPVLTSNKSAIPEICGKAAKYFDPLDPIDIKNKIIDVYNDGYQKQTMIDYGKKQVTKYSWLKTYRETMAVILEA